MKSLRKQAGFATWELLFVVVVLAAVAFVGYHIYSGQKTSVASVPSSTVTGHTATASAAATVLPPAPTITSTSDLDKASAALSQVDPSGSQSADSSQLSSQSNF